MTTNLKTAPRECTHPVPSGETCRLCPTAAEINELKQFCERPLVCPMCDAPDSFTVDARDLGRGYCAAENRTWVVRHGNGYEGGLINVNAAIPMRRVWAMPNACTFDIPPISALVKSYLHKSKVSIDPFARNKRWATYTNDLNPSTAAASHADAVEYLEGLATQGVEADLVLFDPPYSPHQTKECYAGFGHSMKYEDDARHGWSKTRKLLNSLLQPDGIAISCGWDSIGALGQSGRIEEMLIVCHGIGHNDTIVTVERKIENGQGALAFNATAR